MTTLDSVTCLSDAQLLAEAQKLSNDERHATAALVALLAELDARRLYLREGCSSLFTYCTQVLRLSEHAAYGRIEAARAARRFPMLLQLLADGMVTLTTICLLAPHLTPDNHCDVLAAAHHKSKRDVELLVASLRPQPPVPSTLRKLPRPRPETSTSASASDGRLSVTTDDEGSGGSTELPGTVPALVAPLARDRYKLQLTLPAETYDKLRRAQDLLRHSIPSGDLTAIVDRALTLLVAELEQTKFAATNRPRTTVRSTVRSRHIPAPVRRCVWERDEGQCAFIGTHGRCTERGFLEFHHVQPYADGGASVVENLELRCRAHNAYEAEQHFGPLFAREDGGPLFSVRTEYARSQSSSNPS